MGEKSVSGRKVPGGERCVSLLGDFDANFVEFCKLSSEQFDSSDNFLLPVMLSDGFGTFEEDPCSSCKFLANFGETGIFIFCLS